MTTTPRARRRTSLQRRAERRGRRRRSQMRRHLAWAVGAITAVAVIAVVLASVRGPGASRLDAVAPAFELTDTDGHTVSLADYRGRSVLLYFNEGVGCDACFYQQVGIEADEQRFERAGIDVLPVVVNAPDAVRREMQRFGLRTPFLLDPDRRVSAAYDTLGTGHHADLPGHSFVLVDAEGRMRWRLDEPSMFVGTDRLLREATAALPASG